LYNGSGDYSVDGEIISGSDNTGGSIGSDNYPDTYPWTIQTSGSDIYGNWVYDAHFTTVATDDEYKDYFRRVSKTIGKKRGDAIEQ